MRTILLLCAASALAFAQPNDTSWMPVSGGGNNYLPGETLIGSVFEVTGYAPGGGGQGWTYENLRVTLHWVDSNNVPGSSELLHKQGPFVGSVRSGPWPFTISFPGPYESAWLEVTCSAYVMNPDGGSGPFHNMSHVYPIP